jgi:hypothetical protein
MAGGAEDHMAAEDAENMEAAQTLQGGAPLDAAREEAGGETPRGGAGTEDVDGETARDEATPTLVGDEQCRNHTYY